jgi:hypothetical protein
MAVIGWSSGPGTAKLIRLGTAVGTGAAIAQAICAQGSSQPMQPSKAMATGPKRSQIASITTPEITRLLMTSSL